MRETAALFYSITQNTKIYDPLATKESDDRFFIVQVLNFEDVPNLGGYYFNSVDLSGKSHVGPSSSLCGRFSSLEETQDALNKLEKVRNKYSSQLTKLRNKLDSVENRQRSEIVLGIKKIDGFSTVCPSGLPLVRCPNAQWNLRWNGRNRHGPDQGCPLCGDESKSQEITPNE
jgi:hypothetical protein